MTNDNETVEQLCADIKTRIEELWQQDLGAMLNGEVDDFAERFLTAHKREMAHNESLLQKAGATVVELMNKANAQHEEMKKLRGLVVLLTSALSRATVLRCVEADNGIPCKDLLDDDSCRAENCKSMCGRWRELIDKAKKEVKDA